jgi:hypothetical protein
MEAEMTLRVMERMVMTVIAEEGGGSVSEQ